MFFFLMIRRPPRSTLDRSSAASDVYKRQLRGFKIGVTKFASAQGLPFAWQARYHDHIIRNASEWERIRAYIVTNPARWSRDAYFG